MVMHARKHPRLINDGYYDRKDTRLYQSTQYPPKNHQGGHPDRYARRDSPSFRNRDDSPSSRRSPRYANKASYIERGREKLQQGSTSSPGDWRANHYGGSSSNANGGGYDRASKAAKESASSGKDSKERDHRSEVHKSAVGLSGDWSEHISSSGKKYYYNCRTEVSQWEKPKDWVDLPGSRGSDSRSKDSRSSSNRQPAYTSNKSSGDGGRHSSAGDRDRPYRASNHGNRGSFSGSKNTDRSGGLYSGQPTSSAASHGQPQGDYKFSNAGGSSGHPHHNYGPMDDGTYKDRRNHSVYPAHSGSHSGYKRERRDSDNSSRQMTGHYSSRSTEKRATENDRRGSHQTDDMDISPTNTPPYSRQNSRLSGTPILPSSSTPITVTTPTWAQAYSGSGVCLTHTSPPVNSSHGHPSINTLLSPSARPNNQDHEFTQKALQTLQKLQEALSQQLARTVPSSSPGGLTLSNQDLLSNQAQRPHGTHLVSSAGSMGQTGVTLMSMGSVPTSQSLHHQHQALHDDMEKGRETPRSEKSVRSGSPTPSVSSSKDAPVGSSALPVAGIRHTTPQLTPSLANHFNEKLISHVQGWQADHAERQANRFMEEYLTIGSVHCQHVSVELKRARSLVRLAAIQSTLHEQRCVALNALKNQ
ncbi:WW domain-containing adapter protein with coiled-coil-like [Liolophura sinensis]|uniref:WW domain-containing adapter protein with coiled-coil-like n=1 Tax=Liolophura sinensis TaxID=3198878 RepID=UPI0031596BED